ncbi:hypothetical protein [Devosia naphthalenivorans]|uniref:hypothetical protein n=1 Tax=Devosia naphthalenivorans TaxID=2082392 RepID=UPI0013B063BC|nr:hypothetical protein [Devosia naphthalenivorans]
MLVQALVSEDSNARVDCCRQTRVARHGREHTRFRKNLLALIRMQPGMDHSGGNDTISSMALQSGFKWSDLVITSVAMCSRNFTLIGVPMRHWHRPDTMARIHALKSAAIDAGHRCVLVPENAVQKQPRLENATLIDGSRNVEATATERMALLACLIEFGDCSLSDCATLFHGNDPYGAILNLAAKGIVNMDLDVPIGPHSLVKLPAASRT